MMFGRPFEEIQVGDTAQLVKTIREGDVQKFVDLTGDNNPLHVDRKYAETTSMKDIVVHGMIGGSLVSTIIGTQLPGEGALWMSQSFDFLLPVRLGDELTITCTVIKKHERERVLELDAKALNQNKNVIFTGFGKVKVLEAKKTEEKKSPTQLTGAIVTGGTGGIGRAICRSLAADGYGVVINYRSRGDVAEELVREIKEKGGRAIAVKADVTNAKDVEQLVKSASQSFGGVQVLVNNASPKINPKPFEQLEWHEINEHIDAQLKSAFLLSKLCVPIMKTQKAGKIINITSQVLDGQPTPNWTSYALGKSTLATLTRFLAVEMGPHGLNVNCVSPGMTDTALVGDIPEKARLIIARQTPLRRLADPADVAAAVSFLASSKADYITGETLRVNGGQVML